MEIIFNQYINNVFSQHHCLMYSQIVYTCILKYSLHYIFIRFFPGRMFEGNAATMLQSLEKIIQHLTEDSYIWPGIQIFLYIIFIVLDSQNRAYYNISK